MLTAFYRLIEELYTITPYVEQLEDSKKSLKHNVQNACEVRYTICCDIEMVMTG